MKSVTPFKNVKYILCLLLLHVLCKRHICMLCRLSFVSLDASTPHNDGCLHACVRLLELQKKKNCHRKRKFITLLQNIIFFYVPSFFFMSRFEKFPPMSYEMIGKVKERNPLLFRVSTEKRLTIIILVYLWRNYQVTLFCISVSTKEKLHFITARHEPPNTSHTNTI